MRRPVGTHCGPEPSWIAAHAAAACCQPLPVRGVRRLVLLWNGTGLSTKVGRTELPRLARAHTGLACVRMGDCHALGLRVARRPPGAHGDTRLPSPSRCFLLQAAISKGPSSPNGLPCPTPSAGPLHLATVLLRRDESQRPHAAQHGSSGRLGANQTLLAAALRIGSAAIKPEPHRGLARGQ